MLKHFHADSWDGEPIPLEPEEGSPGFREIQELDYSRHVREAIRASELLTHLICDYVAAGHKLLDPSGFCRFAFASNARASMECAARVKWLMSPECGTRERAIRSLRTRLSGLDEQRKAIKARLSRDGEDDGELQRQFSQKSAVIKQQAREIGERQLKGIQDSVQLIRDELNIEPLYRFFSGVVHGHWYAVREVGFDLIDDIPVDTDQQKLVRVEPAFKREAVALAALAVCECYATAVWYCACFRLASTLRIEEFLETGFDFVNLPNRRRFWRSA